MFTGIIEEIGTVLSIRRNRMGASMTVGAEKALPGIAIGDSIAVNGVCLTVVRREPTSFSCDLSSETLERTSFGKASDGARVNLERALQAGGRLGGHFVMGHVDGVGRLGATMAEGAGGATITIEFPRDLERYIVYKGSIAVDGISLTVASLAKSSFNVAAVPYTLKMTNLRFLEPGDSVNLEADILGKYVERFLQSDNKAGAGSKWSLEYLKEQGF